MVAARVLFSSFGVFAIALVSSRAAAEVTVEKSEHGATIKIDGQLFTEYWTKTGHSPALYPIIGPTGKGMTRDFPFQAAPTDGTDDHPHHRSCWFTHGEVNGVDFWGSNIDGNKTGATPEVAHRAFVKLEGGERAGTLVTRNDWMNGDKRVCRDERNIKFVSGSDGSRWIDFAIRIEAPDGDVTFGDTKEGAFAVRVADSMRVDAKTGGRIVNSESQTDEAAWGQPARWVDYTGPINGETVGIAMMCHPKSFHPTPRWHVRTYGLFAANPFGQHDFPNPEAAQQGAVTVPKGDSITLRYRIWLHKGGTNVPRTEQIYQQFAHEP